MKNKTERKKLGKITLFQFGFGGYQDAQIGVSIDISGEGWGVGDFWGMWSRKPNSFCKWTVKDQDEEHAKLVRRIQKLLEDAKKTHIGQLVGLPVEVTFQDNTLKSWRILKEVL